MVRKMVIALLAIAAWVVIALCMAVCASGEDLYILCRPDSNVNIRSNPRKESAVVAWIECGQCVHADGKKKNGFVHVTGLPAEVTEGWIYGGYLVEDEPWIRTYRAEVWDGDVIARGSVNGRRLRKLREGKTVTVYAQTNRWAVTNKGFIMCDWLKEVEE